MTATKTTTTSTTPPAPATAAEARALAERLDAAERAHADARRRQEAAGRIAACTAYTEHVEHARTVNDQAMAAYTAALDSDDPAEVLNRWRAAVAAASGFAEAVSAAHRLADRAGIHPTVHYRPPLPAIDPTVPLADWAARAADRAAAHISEQAEQLAAQHVEQHITDGSETATTPTVWTFTAPRRGLVLFGNDSDTPAVMFTSDPTPGTDRCSFTTADPTVAQQVRTIADQYDITETES